MKASEIIALFRRRCDDSVEPYLTDDDTALVFLSEADREAALRALCLRDESDQDVTQIAVVAGTAVYQLHPSVIQVESAWLTTDPERPLTIVPESDIDRYVSRWRSSTGTPRYLVPIDVRSFRLVHIPEANATLQLAVRRGPLTTLTRPSQSPETPEAWHTHLVEWMLYRHYGQPSADQNNAAMAAAAYQAFEMAVGPRRSLNQAAFASEHRRNTTRTSWPG